MPSANPGSGSSTFIKEGQRVVDTELRSTLKDILLELRILNAHMENVTDEDIVTEDLPLGQTEHSIQP